MENALKTKLISDKQEAFCQAYCNNGYNASQAYRTAYPNCKSAWDSHGARQVVKDSIKARIASIKAVMAAEDVNSREFVTKSFLELAKTTKGKDNGTYTRALENLAKNSGWYEADNEQQREHSELNEQQQADLDEFIAWKHRQMLRGA